MKIQRSTGEQRKLDRFGRCEKARINYVASGVKSGEADQALQEVFAQAPDHWQNIPKNSVELLRSPGGGVLEIGVYYRQTDTAFSYRKRRNKRAGDRRWQAEVNAGTGWKKYAVAKILSVKADKSSPDIDPERLINWNGLPGSASRSEKFRIYEPEMSLCCEATFRRKQAEARDYLRKVANLVGKVNSGAFHNWNAGEVLFLGLVKSDPFEGDDGEELCDLTFRFQIRLGGIRKIGSIDLGMVEGWDHCWPLYTADGKLHSAHVSRLYERASFAVLDL